MQSRIILNLFKVEFTNIVP